MENLTCPKCGVALKLADEQVLEVVVETPVEAPVETPVTTETPAEPAS